MTVGSRLNSHCAAGQDLLFLQQFVIIVVVAVITLDERLYYYCY